MKISQKEVIACYLINIQLRFKLQTLHYSYVTTHLLLIRSRFYCICKWKKYLEMEKSETRWKTHGSSVNIPQVEI